MLFALAGPVVVGVGFAAKQGPALLAAPAASTVLLGIEDIGTARTTDGVLRQYGSSTGVLRRYFRRAPGAGFKAPGPARQVADLFLVAHAAELGIDPARIDNDLHVRYVRAITAQTGRVHAGPTAETVIDDRQRALTVDFKRYAILGPTQEGPRKYAFEVFDLETMSRLYAAPFPLASQFGLRFSPDGKHLFVASQVRVDAFDAHTGQFSHGYPLDGTRVAQIEDVPGLAAEFVDNAARCGTHSGWRRE